MPSNTYCAVYDFELMPYALGDVLTWNVKTAVECELAGCEKVDIYISHDPRYPASIYQRDTVTRENHGLFFSELSGAFGTHPRLGNQFVFRSRDEMLLRLQDAAMGNAANANALSRYMDVVKRRDDEQAVIDYFTQSIHTHEQLNAFAAKTGRIPLLQPSDGCMPDIDGLLASRFAGKRMVAVHTRLRRLDAGYGGSHSHARDSDVLDWYEFLREAGAKHPDVMFVLLGRLQEKPVEFLRLSNVLNLRTLGLGLGHELSLITRCNLFMGTSSGFAAMANFCTTPYFITRMTPESCKAYQIPNGADRLPFAQPGQFLVYEPESPAMLMRLLETGLQGAQPPYPGAGPGIDKAIDVRSWDWERAQWLAPNATTYRFFVDDDYSDKEMAVLVYPKLREAHKALTAGNTQSAERLLKRIEASFPRACARFKDYLTFKKKLARLKGDREVLQKCDAALTAIHVPEGGVPKRIANAIIRLAKWSYPTLLKLRDIWKRKYRIPRRVLSLVKKSAMRGHIA